MGQILLVLSGLYWFGLECFGLGLIGLGLIVTDGRIELLELPALIELFACMCVCA